MRTHNRFATYLAALLMLTCINILVCPASYAVSYTSILTPWLRLDDGPYGLRTDSKSRYLAYTSEQGVGLKVIDLETKKVLEVTKEYVGTSYFWAPDGIRLFYREQIRKTAAGKGDAKDNVTSKILAFDTKLNKSVLLDNVDGPTGLLTFDPRDLRMYVMQKDSILSKRLTFPNDRLARWQIAQRTDNGRWIATQNGMLWITQAGAAMRRLDDDGSPIESFSISPDGTTAAWASTLGNIWVSRAGSAPKKLDRGRDPTWHPEKPILLYAGARIVGNQVQKYNLKVSDLNGSSRFLTYTQHGSERWPQWHADSQKIIYTQERSTDIFLMEFTK